MKIFIYRNEQVYGPYPPDSVNRFIKEKRASLKDTASLEGMKGSTPLQLLLENLVFSRPQPTTEGWSLLLHACLHGDRELVESLLANGVDLEARDGNGRSPLYWAACNENEEQAAGIISSLLEKGVNINERSPDGRTALIGAAISDNVSTLKTLLDAEADPELVTEEHHLGALFLAASRSIEAVNVLLAGGADPNIRNIVDATPIFEAIDSL